jgi:hypothetical protein
MGGAGAERVGSAHARVGSTYNQVDHGMKEYFSAALENIFHFGDTDIFPFPFETHVLRDKKDQIVESLGKAFSNFDTEFYENAPSHLNVLVPVGLTGFRLASQLDPFWNAFLLGVTLSIARDIERSRIVPEKQAVFSYRVADCFDKGSVFRADIGWKDFNSQSISLAEQKSYVVICDISDCYQRIPHHRLENALRQIDGGGMIPNYIMKILDHFSNGRSYSLPVGGPASRILAECHLNLTDQLLKSNQIAFARYADDYHIFVDSLDKAYECLLFLSEKLIRNEGLSLQKSKTRVMSSAEFIAARKLMFSSDDEEINSDIRHLFSLNLRYDPYSATAEEDYENLKEELDQIDIIGILNRELAKTRVHGAVAKRVVQTIRHLDSDARQRAVLTLADNLDILYPIFPVVAVAIKNCFSDLDKDAQEEICTVLRERVVQDNFLVSTDFYASYTIRVLAEQRSSDNVDAVVRLHKKFPSPIVRRDVILAMAKWGEFPWLSDLMNDYQGMSPWERRAFIVASYSLKDAGKHWRDRTKRRFSAFETIVRDWVAEKRQQADWAIPL